MKITEVSYGRTKSKNFQGERMEMTATVGEGESWQDVLDTLRVQVAQQLFPEELEELAGLEQEIEARRRSLGVGR
jgi:hypothetical protein